MSRSRDEEDIEFQPGMLADAVVVLGGFTPQVRLRL
jgi:hypothetical protein